MGYPPFITLLHTWCSDHASTGTWAAGEPVSPWTALTSPSVCAQDTGMCDITWECLGRRDVSEEVPRGRTRLRTGRSWHT